MTGLPPAHRWTAAAGACLVTVAGPGVPEAAADVPPGAQGTVSAVLSPVAGAVSETVFRVQTAHQRIPMPDGTVISARVYAPHRAPGDTGRPPLLVMPAASYLGEDWYTFEAPRYAAAGYLVIAYAERGIGGSTGYLDFAGSRDVADLSRVVDWAVDAAQADPARVGVYGCSYGASVGLQAAAVDPRIKAVAAFNAWTDFARAFYTHDTEHELSAWFHALAAQATERPGSDLAAGYREFLRGDSRAVGQTLHTDDRSPIRRVDGLNAHGTAVFMVNNWYDTGLAAPDQIAEFFSALQGPKYLEMRPGEHAEAIPYCLGPTLDAVCSRARDWLDLHVRGRNTGMADAAPLTVRPRTAGPDEYYASWESMAASAATPAPVLPGGRRTITTGRDSGADAGIPVVTPALDKRGLPPTVVMPLLPPTTAAVWQSEPSAAPWRVRGTPRVTLGVTPSAATGTFFAYLYDVDPLGVGQLVTHTPYTFRGRAPGVPFTVDTDFTTTAYTVPAGHRIALVVDSADPLYRQHNPAEARLTFADPRLGW
ncbi:CocE/NonD family hydrolase [Yinghuangia sp. YIM S10712]|uniref:CocE/NonD family hydrolase n=1 Tax=Yinghuangia sp. YIM S10712 TaxID=3436930 RepID=UPI003F52CAEA